MRVSADAQLRNWHSNTLDELKFHMQEIPDFIFTPKAEALTSAGATVNLYQVLLGREPENPFVIEENKTQPVGDLFRSFIYSNEFKEFVVSPILRGFPLRHELLFAAPTFAQLDWLTSLIVLAPAQLASVRRARSWREFFCALLSISLPDVDGEAGESAPAGSLYRSTAKSEKIDAALHEIAAIEGRIEELKSMVRGIRGPKR